MDDAPEVSAKAEKLQESSTGAGEAEPRKAEEPHRKKEDEPMLFCPVCSKRLSELKCKLFCEQCGYYMSCADYY